jgi:hypothetical protein
VVPIFTRAIGWLFFMNWINIKTSDLRSPEFIGSDPTARGTWVAVLGYCYEQENGGRIKGCNAWKDRQWQQVCGVTREEIDGAKSLMNWEGDDLQVWGYPADLEDEIKRKREAGRKGGQARTQAKIEAAKANGAKHNPSITQAEPKQEPNVIVIERVIEKKEKEGKDVAEVSAISDEDWLNQLATNPAYSLIDVRREYSKMQTWCSVNRKMPTRRRFVAWLNRIEKPMDAAKGNRAHESIIDRS